MEITIPPRFAKFILRVNPFRRVMVVCKGYGEEMENFTELIWADDNHPDFEWRKFLLVRKVGLYEQIKEAVEPVVPLVIFGIDA